MRFLTLSLLIIIIAFSSPGQTIPLDGRGGGIIAFSSDRDGQSEIYLMNADGSGQRNITNHPSVDLIPKWSPDGNTLAFLSSRADGFKIFVITVIDIENGTFSEPVQVSQYGSFSFSWSPDGAKFVFVRENNNIYDLYTMNIDGSDLTRLTDTEYAEFHPDWSPDGTKIAFTLTNEEGQNIYIMDLNESHPYRLTDNNASFFPSWSPIGNRIAYNSSRPGQQGLDICLRNVDGSNERFITDYLNHDEFPSWSSDGTRITYESDRNGFETIYVVDVGSGSTIPLTNNRANDGGPDWRPYNIGFTSLYGPYMGQEAPGMVAKLFYPGIFTYELHSQIVFSPDGQEAYWREMESGINEIVFSNQESGNWTLPAVVSFANDYYTDNPFFTQDGNRMFFTSIRPIEGINKRFDESIWYTDRLNNGWTEPVPVSPYINSHEMHWQFSVAANNNIYHQSLNDNGDFGDIYLSVFDGSDYTESVSLGDSVNSVNSRISEATPFVAPDESYIIFSRINIDISGYADLYISFKKPDGSWSTAKNMDIINTDLHELCPLVTLDNNYLFFLSNRNNELLPYWISSQVIDNYRIATGIEKNIKSDVGYLFQNYPNPFSINTNISFKLEKASKISVLIYDAKGKEINILIKDEFLSDGLHNFGFNASSLTNGIYYYKLESDNNFAQIKKMCIIK